MIRVSGLKASYYEDEILHGVDAEFPEGKISVIIGPNGCGKSTTIRSIVRLVPDMEGSFTMDGKDLSELSQAELAKKIAYLPQSRSVPEITVGKLVMHGRFPYLSYPRRYRPEDREKVRQALEWVGMSHLAEKRMDAVSGGQRQMAYLAMALAQGTDVILMDEPTTFLDIRNQFEMLDRSRSLADSGKTIIMILHDFEAVLRYADHVVLMGGGRVHAAGTAREVLGSEAIKEVFGVEPRFFEADDGLHCYVSPEKL